MIQRLIAISLILLTTPIWLSIVIMYLLSGRTNFFFFQPRLGKNITPFTLYKFRTLEGDTRETINIGPFEWGSFLRRTGFDELPQLINIMKGEMNFIGPRALPVEYEPFFSKKQRVRFRIKPGITGWAQVNGRTGISWDKKLDYDIQYVRDWSFGLDFKILRMTLMELMFNRNSQSLSEETLISYKKRTEQIEKSA